jgi:hypothetical protein
MPTHDSLEQVVKYLCSFSDRPLLEQRAVYREEAIQ